VTRHIHRLRIPDETADLIRGLHPELKRKIKAALKVILSDPYAGKALKDDLSGLKSYRVGKLRIIYQTHGKELQIITIGPRKKIYLETYRRLKKS
jgi:mRNA interferase RelE/StbE